MTLPSQDEQDRIIAAIKKQRFASARKNVRPWCMMWTLGVLGVLGILVAVFVIQQIPKGDPLWPFLSHAQQIPALSESRTIPGLQSRPSAVPIPPGWQVFYAMHQGPWEARAQGGRHMTIRGKTVAVSLLEQTLGPPPTQPVKEAAQHSAEETIFVLDDTVKLVIEGQTRVLTHLSAALIPPGVRHELWLSPGSRCLIFSTTPLVECLTPPLLSARPSRSSTEAKVVVTDFAMLPWIGRSGQARFKTTAGKNCTLTLWHTPATALKGTHVPGHHHTIEQISYTVEGQAEARVGDRIQRIGPDMCAVVPSDVDHGPVKAVTSEDLLLLDFQPVVRTDLLERQRRQE